MYTDIDVQKNVVRGCVKAVLGHATLDYVYLDSRARCIKIVPGPVCLLGLRDDAPEPPPGDGAPPRRLRAHHALDVVRVVLQHQEQTTTLQETAGRGLEFKENGFMDLRISC